MSFMTIVTYDVCRLWHLFCMTFVAYDVFECVAYRVCPSAVWLSTTEIDSAVWCTSQRLTLWSNAQSRDWLSSVMHTPEFFLKMYCPWLRGMMHTTEIVSAVWWTPQILTPPCDVHHGDCLCSMMHTTEIGSEGCIPTLSQSPSSLVSCCF